MIQYGDILSRSGEVEADVLRADLVALLTDTLCRICTTPLWLDRDFLATCPPLSPEGA